MTKEEKYIARLIFKNKLYEADKQSFEDLFTKVMEASDSGFKQIKPQGKYGDGKCDGFNSILGIYYQVYAPENLSGNEKTANKKLDDAVAGIIKFWKANNFDVKKCFFVVNDKFQHLYATAHTNAKSVSLKYDIDCEMFTCRNLMDLFLSLDEDSIINIIGIIPDPLNISTVDYSIMSEVIGFLLKSKGHNIKEAIPSNPDFENKIIFNRLSTAVSSFLSAGQRQYYVIKDYFELNSKFDKEELRLIFNDFYNQAKQEIPDSETKSDEIFQYIVEKSCPQDNFIFYNAVYVLMAYYFEYCDIFETPST
jgi:hypothetical protein